jgi:hypothetical protein
MSLNNNTFENEYILGILTAFASELRTNKPQAEILDKYAVELTAYMNGKQASAMKFSVQELRPEVMEFALLMEARLRIKEADKGTSWKQSPMGYLRVAMFSKASLLERELTGVEHGMPLTVATTKHAVDLANHAMFIADVAGALEDTDDNGGPGWAGVDQVVAPLEIPAFLRAHRGE